MLHKLPTTTLRATTVEHKRLWYVTMPQPYMLWFWP